MNGLSPEIIHGVFIILKNTHNTRNRNLLMKGMDLTHMYIKNNQIKLGI